MTIKLTPAYIKRLLKKPSRTAIRDTNLHVEVGTGKTKLIHLRFYWRKHGTQKYRKLGSLGANCTAKQCDAIQEEYLDLFSNWNRGISPELIEKQTDIQRQHQEEQLQRQAVLKTVDEIWQDFYDRRLEGKASAATRRYNYEKHIKPHIGASAADHVGHQTLINLIRDASTDGYSAGNTTSQILSTIGNYGADNGLPADSKSWARLPKNPKPARTRLATDKELAWLLTRGAALVRTSVFLGQRAWQHLKIEWEEIEGDWLTIPARKMKTNNDHRVFITTTVHDLFQESRARFPKGHRNFDSDWIFAGGRIGHPVRVETGHKEFKDTNVQSVQRKSEPASLRMQDLRRTCYTFIEKHFSQVISGAVAGHTKDAMGRVYGQYDYEKEKREAMLEWEKYLLNLMK